MQQLPKHYEAKNFEEVEKAADSDSEDDGRARRGGAPKTSPKRLARSWCTSSATPSWCSATGRQGRAEADQRAERKSSSNTSGNCCRCQCSSSRRLKARRGKCERRNSENIARPRRPKLAAVLEANLNQASARG